MTNRFAVYNGIEMIILVAYVFLSPVAFTLAFKLANARPSRTKDKNRNKLLLVVNIIRRVLGFVLTRLIVFAVSYFAKYVITLAIVLPWDAIAKGNMSDWLKALFIIWYCSFVY